MKPYRLLAAMASFAVWALSGHSASWTGSIAATRSSLWPITAPVTVTKGDLITVTVEGTVSTGSSRNWHGPEGSYESGRRHSGYTCGIVIMRVAQHDIPIEGGRRTLVVPHTGQISLYVNDDGPDDNQGAFTVTVNTFSRSEEDADEDDLPDELEDRLLDYYSPHLRHSLQGEAQEDVLPCDAWWFLRNAQFDASGETENCGKQEPNPGRAPYYPEWFLMGLHGCDRTTSPNHLDTLGGTEINANIEDNYRKGAAALRVKAAKGIGLYGHAVPTPEGILLQYWQLYASNDIDISLLPDWGEHEGDWELVEVLVERSDPFNVSLMKEARWYAHGLSQPAVTWRRGDWSTRSGAGMRLGEWPDMPVQHIPVLIERGSHGMWPTTWAFNSYTGENNGLSYSYIPSSVQNLGEVFRPRLGAEVVLHFNGRWGKSKKNDPFGISEAVPPRGPAQKNWPHVGPSDEVRYVGNWDQGSLRPDGASAPKGRISWPHRSVAEAAAANAVTTRSEIHIYPGVYADAVTISIPTTLKAPYGNVIVGQ